MENLMTPVRELTEQELDAVCGGRGSIRTGDIRATQISVVIRSSQITVNQNINSGFQFFS
jgi:hypothetical protein